MKTRISNQKITTNLWFDKEAEEAVKFYTTVFKDGKDRRIARYTSEGQEVHGMPEGTAMTIEFQIEGREFLALNAGPHFKFNEAISFIVNCDTRRK